MKLYIIAGEASGDLIGAGLLKQLYKLVPNLEVKGIGGQLMEKEGLKSLFSISEISVFGFVEVLFKIFQIKKLINKTIEDIKKYKPDLIITIDSLGFNKRVVKQLRALDEFKNTKFIHYVAPTVWIWKPKRALELSKLYDALLCLFEFEIPYFTKVGLKTICVGHPISTSNADSGNKENFYNKYPTYRNTNNILLMPGSRKSEVTKLLPIYLKTIKNLNQSVFDLKIILPTVPHLKSYLEKFIKDNNLNWLILDNIEDKYDAYKAVKVAIIASGTTSLELLLVNNLPIIVTYKVNILTYLIAKMLLHTKYISMLNIISNKEIIREYIQYDCNYKNITNEVLYALNNKENYYSLENKKMIASILKSLGYKSFFPDIKAAQTVINIYNNK